MQSLTKHLSINYKPCILYLDDLQTIYNILHEVSPNIIVSSKEYEFENIDDISKLENKTIHYLIMQINEPHIKLEFANSSISFYASKDDFYTRGIASKIKEVFAKRERPLMWLFNPKVTGGIIGTSIALYFLKKEILPLRYIPLIELVSYLLFVFGLLFGWYSMKIDFNRYATIHLENFKSKISFWQKNKDAILLAILSAIFGAILSRLIK